SMLRVMRYTMRVQKSLAAAILLLALTFTAADRAAAQEPPAPPAQGGRGAGGGGRRAGGFVPGQQRPPEDPAVVQSGKILYRLSCTGCHGADLRGGDIGGPNLLRSQVALSDQNGELIVPIIQGARQSSGMPAIDMSPDDAKAVAAYVRTV